MIRLLIVDDQELVRTGFRLILDFEPDIDVVGEATDGRDCLRLVSALQPDVVLMDIRMPALDGIETTQRLAAAGSGARVLILTTFDLDDYVYAALRAGASGYLVKDAPRAQLVDAVRAVARGDALLAPTVVRRMIDRFVRLPPPGDLVLPEKVRLLSDREREVLARLARGLSNAEIASELVISDATVKTHVARLLSKLGVRDRIQAIVLAYETGFIRPGDRPDSGKNVGLDRPDGLKFRG
ncbi:response regulator transcription factor [Microlunatus elymi]|uniref:Response regulator transcription factor n=1 Tax=Microlunatus elymi TaxID=2596828 RepID=A0A516Q4D0_9ACTN|nr:response regulator transcription factor [Microlunatus elymi]QDP98289.1 response regulator transcription factor [Microlunatus elymi]